MVGRRIGSMSGAGALGASLGVLVGVALEMDFHAFGQETPAAFLATAREDILAIGRLHALAVPELLFAGALGGLVGSEGHKTGKSGVRPGRSSARGRRD